MFSLYLGIVGFVLYFIYDVNSFTIKFRPFHFFFLVGTVLIGVATVIDLWFAWKSGAIRGILDILLLVSAFFSFSSLIYSLLFALPFKETYTEENVGNKVCSSGVYALCRHPGILCFGSMYLFIGLAALPSRMFINCWIFSLVNLFYAVFQDCITFPKIFCDYEEYKKNVPFLIPTKNSILVARKTLLDKK